MQRKDCDNSNRITHTARACATYLTARVLVASAVCAVSAAVPANAGSVRVWPASVVVDELIHLVDVCGFTGFEAETETRLAGIVLGAAPKPGETRVLEVDAIRSALVDGRVNMAHVTLAGASRCSITRPSDSPNGPSARQSRKESRTAGDPRANAQVAVAGETLSNSITTLRDAVINYFERELKRYPGKADIVFDRAAEEMLSLSGRGRAFKVRRRNASPLGLVQIGVDVLVDGMEVQTIPLVVNVSLIQSVAVARRPINQGATVRTSDVDFVSLTLRRLNRMGVTDISQLLGKRAKKFIATGSFIHADALEEVPLVTRGQLVQLTSHAGNIQIVTTTKAMQSGLLGETITVRSLDRNRTEFDATIVGRGRVQVGNGRVTSIESVRDSGGQL